MDAPAAKKQASADASGSPTPTERLLIGVPKKGTLPSPRLALAHSNRLRVSFPPHCSLPPPNARADCTAWLRL